MIPFLVRGITFRLKKSLGILNYHLKPEIKKLLTSQWQMKIECETAFNVDKQYNFIFSLFFNTMTVEFQGCR